jgi:hypothetical protein
MEEIQQKLHRQSRSLRLALIALSGVAVLMVWGFQKSGVQDLTARQINLVDSQGRDCGRISGNDGGILFSLPHLRSLVKIDRTGADPAYLNLAPGELTISDGNKTYTVRTRKGEGVFVVIQDHK